MKRKNLALFLAAVLLGYGGALFAQTAKDAQVIVENATSGVLVAVEAGAMTTTMSITSGGQATLRIPAGVYTIRASVEKGGEKLLIEENVEVAAGGEYNWRLIDKQEESINSDDYLDDLYYMLQDYLDSYGYLEDDYDSYGYLDEEAYGYLDSDTYDAYGYLEDDYYDAYGYLEDDYYDAYGYLEDDYYDAYGYLEDDYYDAYGYLEDDYYDAYGYLEADYYDTYGYLEDDYYDAYGYLENDSFDAYGYLENSYAYLDTGGSKGKNPRDTPEPLPQLALLGGAVMPIGKTRASKKS